MTGSLYQYEEKKSRLFLVCGGFFCHFQNISHFIADGFVVLSAVGAQAVGAVLDALFRITEAASAPVSQSIEGAIAKDTAEGFRIGTFMAGKIFTLLILKEIVVTHIYLHFSDIDLHIANNVVQYSPEG